MDLSVPFKVNVEVRKNMFKSKPTRVDGLLLKIHYSKSNSKIRFVHCCFHETGHIIASADNDGHLYLVDFLLCKCWGLPKLDSCTFITFSAFNQNDILCGRPNGDIQLIDLDSGYVTGTLYGHKEPVTRVSFSQKTYCLSTSKNEAIIWDLKSNTKLRVLLLENNTNLKHGLFMPVSNHVLICFQDDLIQIWKSNTFDLIKQFLPSDLKDISVKSIDFSRNGQSMVIASHLPILAIVLLNKWRVSKFITLPECIQTVKSVGFVAQPFDGGSNKVLAILAGHGTIYFYDIEQNVIISQLATKCEIIKFQCCPNGTYIACILCSGEVELYNLTQYVSPSTLSHDVVYEKVKTKSKSITQKMRESNGDIVKIQIDDMLDIDKLRAILKEYEEYPIAHRTLIWEKLLRLPSNINQYNKIINRVTKIAFKDLYTKYPLESKTSVQSLKKLLNNIVTWCPFFAQVDYLPVFVFPFVKVFHNKPVSCFEAVCTVILNWCQHWFEYFPLPPINTLAMIENILMEHDPELLQHFLSKEVTANLYAWPLLESAFSEVVTASEWLVLWDHILTNEPSFLHCAVVAYNIVHRMTLLSIKNMHDFEFFYHNQNPNDIKKFINKTYYLLNNTSNKVHPRQYLSEFKGIQAGNYPLFVEFPKTIIDFQAEHIKGVDTKLLDMEKYEQDLILKAGLQWEDARKCMLQEEEDRRKKEMEKECAMKIEKEREKIKVKYDELECLRKILGEQEDTVLSGIHTKWSCVCNKKQTRLHEYVMDRIYCPCVDEHKLTKEQLKHITQFTELLKYKYRINELENTDMLNSDVEHDIIKKHRKKLNAEIDKFKMSLYSKENLKRINIAQSVIVMEELIKNIGKELRKESDLESTSLENIRIKSLQAETRGLAKEVSKLMDRLCTECNKKPRDRGDSPLFKEEKPAYKLLYSKNVRFSGADDCVR